MKMDFRSDTVTHPTLAMREAMLKASVGDDVYQDDPSVNALQDYACELFNMEAALYVPSGTMGNLLALLAHCNRGEGVLLGKSAHIWIHEGGGIGCIAGLMPYTLDDSEGIPRVEEIKSVYRPAGDVHVAPTTLLALENTHNDCGGIPVALPKFAHVCGEGKKLGLKIHLDGARIFNACATFDVQPADYAKHVDSLQCCLSKGLAAPVGSLLCGKKDFIEHALFWRKRLGGGQRQVGIVAAAGLVALRDMRRRLVEDHKRAAQLAAQLESIGYTVEQIENRTNMVYFQLPESVSDHRFLEHCTAKGLKVNEAEAGRVRLVTHYGIDDESVKVAVGILRELLQ